jgi:hypothetical protein
MPDDTEPQAASWNMSMTMPHRKLQYAHDDFDSFESEFVFQYSDVFVVPFPIHKLTETR